MAPRGDHPCASQPSLGSVQFCLFEQWCTPGHGAPTHLHAVEEVLTVLAGTAQIRGRPPR